ncbi:MAG: hypothetical protein MSG64_09920 [Pyrinomonadaceae bacterium MAG19_C2-C3]|nr:hypothetical protein [Pyrinomonadaceae bacterium MAG19_C2-C3]
MKYKSRVSAFVVLCVMLSGAMNARAQVAGISALPTQDGVRAAAAYKILKYDIAVQLPAASATSAADRAMSVTATLDARNVGNGAGRTFTVRLNTATEMRAVQVGGAAATFTKRLDERAKLQQITVALPSPIAPNATLSVRFEYRLPVERNSGLLAVGVDGAQALPLSSWYPTPNTLVSPRGLDSAPFRLTVTTPNAGDTLISSGRSVNANTYEQSLDTQPFFLTGKWTSIESDANTRAFMFEGARPEERARADEMLKLAIAARAFFSQTLGGMVDVPVRVVAVRRGAGYDNTGTILIDASAFRRSRLDAATAVTIAEGIAHLWIGGTTPIGGEGAGVVREGLTRYLATLFIEKQFGAEAAAAERTRSRLAYLPVANRDAPLSDASAQFDTYYTSVTNKGALIWNLIENTLGRERMLRVLAAQVQNARADKSEADSAPLTLDALRAALIAEAGSAGATMTKLLAHGFDQPTDMDLLIGVPQQRGGEYVAALRNTGSLDALVAVSATLANGERLNVTTTVPARDFGEARFRTASPPVRVEVDPQKIYPQLDYSNDVAPARVASVDDPLNEANRLIARSDFAAAEINAREALLRTPNMSEARTLLARALLGANKLDAAEAEFRRVLEAPLPSASSLAWANIGLGDIARTRGQIPEAARRYDEAARTDAEYATTFAARNRRLQTEGQAAVAAPVDEAVRAFVTRFDAAIKSGRRADIEALVASGEIPDFAKGIAGNQPEVWTTRVLRTEALSANLIAADVQFTTRVLGVDKEGPALMLLVRDNGNLKLAAFPIFEVR